jgi:hypothetical protein
LSASHECRHSLVILDRLMANGESSTFKGMFWAIPDIGALAALAPNLTFVLAALANFPDVRGSIEDT